VVGLFVGFAIANWYESAHYAPERPGVDDVRFDVGGVLVLCWLVIGIIGSALFISWARRSGRRPAA
jgi:hypothetical protein